MYGNENKACMQDMYEKFFYYYCTQAYLYFVFKEILEIREYSSFINIES